MKPMQKPSRFPLHFSTAIQKMQSTQYRTEDFFDLVLEKCPDIKTLKLVHFKIISEAVLYLNASLAIKPMKAYIACGEPNITRNVFDKIPERNNVIFNVMIRSYVNNQFYKDAIFMRKSMLSRGVAPDHYTLPCVLKACSALHRMILGSGCKFIAQL